MDQDLDREMKLSFIEEAEQLLDSAEKCFLDLESNSGDPRVIEALFRLAHNLKGTSRAVGFGEVAAFTHELENLLLNLKTGALQVDDETVDLLLKCNDRLKEMVEALRADLNASFDNSELMQMIAIKVSGGMISPEAQLNNSVDETISQARVEEFLNRGAALERASPSAASTTPEAATGTAAKANSADQSIRVSLSRLERLNDFVGELVILQTVLNQHRQEAGSQLVQKSISQLGKLSKEIQGLSMGLRMIPLKQTFSKLQRTVRDTSKACGKNVDLRVIGEETEVDRTVLEHLGDPLVHIVRNAIDHGLETPAEREAVGKSASGIIEISAFHQGQNLVIEIRDDGQGIDAERLVRKAIEKKILPPDAKLSESEAMQLIFKPGYSTKDQVSEISGRGVGLDVVKQNVEKLSGQVQLESKLGSGSVFRLVLPLTLAIVDAMIIKIAGERYAVPISSVRESVRPKPDEMHSVTGRGEYLSLRDEVMPLFSLASLLRVTRPASEKLAASDSIALIAKHRGQPFAVLVDDILRQQQIVIKKLGAEYRSQKGMSGSAILGDGRPALILDLSALVETLDLSAVSSPRVAAGVRA